MNIENGLTGCTFQKGDYRKCVVLRKWTLQQCRSGTGKAREAGPCVSSKSTGVRKAQSRIRRYTESHSISLLSMKFYGFCKPGLMVQIPLIQLCVHHKPPGRFELTAPSWWSPCGLGGGKGRRSHGQVGNEESTGPLFAL